jgi:hypothetical protein
VLVDSLDLYYRTLKGEGSRAAAILADSGFIGCGSAGSRLSERSKDELVRTLRVKT